MTNGPLCVREDGGGGLPAVKSEQTEEERRSREGTPAPTFTGPGTGGHYFYPAVNRDGTQLTNTHPHALMFNKDVKPEHTGLHNPRANKKKNNIHS